MLTKLCLIVSLLSGTALAQMPSAKDEQAIRKLVADFADAWNKHDSHAFAETFAEDADFTNVCGDSALPCSDVCDPIQEHSADGGRRQDPIPLLRDRIRGYSLGNDRGTETNGTPMPTRKALLNWVVAHHGDRWLISVMHKQELTPQKR
jgi:hypothetical protein